MARARRVKPDEQLTLVEHLDELRTRIIVVIGVLAVSVAGCFWFNEEILEYLKTPLPDDVADKLVTLAPQEAFFNAISISVYGGLLITMPVLTYQIYAFVIPAFDPEHHSVFRPLVLMIPVLFVAGVAFGWFVITPAALTFLTNFNSGAVEYIPRAKDYIQFVMLSLLAMGVVFQIPVVMLTLGRIGLVTSDQMRRTWRIAIVVLAVLAALAPGADPVSMVLTFIPLVVLYGFSYFLVRSSERRRSGAELDDLSPT